MVRFNASTENLHPNFTCPHLPPSGGAESTIVAVREFLRANGIFTSWAIPKKHSIQKLSNCTKKALQLSALKGQGQDFIHRLRPTSLATRDSTRTGPNICRPAANTRASRCMWGKTSKAQGRRLLPDETNGPIKLLILVTFARVETDRTKTISHRVLGQTADGSS